MSLSGGGTPACRVEVAEFSTRGLAWNAGSSPPHRAGPATRPCDARARPRSCLFAVRQRAPIGLRFFASHDVDREVSPSLNTIRRSITSELAPRCRGQS